MDYLQIALIVLAVAGVWAVVEVALTMRSARRDIERLTTSATEVIEQAQPVVAKLDGIADELEPAAKQAAPLLKKAEGAVDSAHESLDRLNGILEDVSSVSGTASSVTGAVNRVAESAASGVASVVSRLRGGSPAEGPARLDAHEGEGADGFPEPERVTIAGAAAEREARPETRYVDYGDLSAADDAPAGAGQE